MTMQKARRKAFTLLELLVVIAIIAILAAVFMHQYRQIRENGWSSRCKANLRSLYQAALNYTVEHGGGYPHAGPWEYPIYNAQGVIIEWREEPAWVNFVSTAGPWPHGSSGQYISSPSIQPFCGSNGRTSIERGTLWEYTLHEKGIYYCPKFRYLTGRSDVARSYVMNGKYGYSDNGTNVNFGEVSGDEASRTLLFADMSTQQRYLGTPAMNVCSVWAGCGGAGDDGVLTTNWVSQPTQMYDSIGFLHRMGGDYCGHAVFLDGHIEAIRLQQPSGSWSNRTYDACIGQF